MGNARTQKKEKQNTGGKTMGSMNRVFLMGNVTRNLELRHTPSGIAVADMGLAVSESYRNKSGETVESTCFVDVVVWARQAETCAEYLAKGSAVMVEGSLQYDKWETDSGEKRSKLRVRANRVQFVGRPRKDAASAGSEDRAEKEAEIEQSIPF